MNWRWRRRGPSSGVFSGGRDTGAFEIGSSGATSKSRILGSRDAFNSSVEKMGDGLVTPVEVHDIGMGDNDVALYLDAVDVDAASDMDADPEVRVDAGIMGMM